LPTYNDTVPVPPYRGRLAPSPTGLMHIGHAATFWTAYQHALQRGGGLVFRDEDLDPQRSKPSYAEAMLEDLRWLGIRWQEGPDVGGPLGPYRQSERRQFYLAAWRKPGTQAPFTRARVRAKTLRRRRPLRTKEMMSRSTLAAAANESAKQQTTKLLRA